MADPAPGGTAGEGPPAWRRPAVLGVGLVSLVLVVWIAWRADPQQVWRTLRSVDARLVAVAAAVSFTALGLRALRWLILLRPVDSRRTVSWLDSATGVTIGYLGNNLLPSRSGELLRSYALQRKTGIPFGVGFGTVVTERVFDALLLFALLVLLLLLRPLAPQAVDLTTVLLLGGGIYLAGLLGLLALRRFKAGLLAGLERWTRRLPERWSRRLQGFFRGFLTSLFTFGSRRQLVSYAAVSLGIWSLEVAVFGCMMQAFRIDLEVPQIALAVILAAFSTALPALPGALGTYELVVVSTLEVMDVPTSLATAFTVSSHALLWSVANFAGLLAILRLGTGFRGLAVEAPPAASVSPPVGGTGE